MVLIVSLLVLTSAHGDDPEESVDEPPGFVDDTDVVSATLSDCTVDGSGGGLMHETCVLESPDVRVAGTWLFSYTQGPVFDGEGVHGELVQQGDVTIDTGDGQWEGHAERALFEGGADVEGVDPGSKWAMDIRVNGTDNHDGLEMELGGEGDTPGPPYALDGYIAPVSGYSTAANVARVVFPLIVFGLLVTGAVISVLKGRWWMGLVGTLGFGVFLLWTTLQGSLDIDLLGGFEESVRNRIGLAIFFATAAGGLLLLLGAVLPPRPGSWWDRRRPHLDETPV